MKKLPFLLGLSPLLIAAAPATPHAIAENVSQQNIRAIVQRLVSFGTRHTLSSQTDPRRGIGAALRWTESEFRRYSKACGGCPALATPSDVLTGRRVATRPQVTKGLGHQRGTSAPKDAK